MTLNTQDGNLVIGEDKTMEDSVGSTTSKDRKSHWYTS